MQEERGRCRTERSDKKIRVNSSLSEDLHEKLDRLALACGVTKPASLPTWLSYAYITKISLILFKTNIKNPQNFGIKVEILKLTLYNVSFLFLTENLFGNKILLLQMYLSWYINHRC